MINVGGTDYNSSQFNRAISAKRQVGSTMKPFLYYAALENNMVSSSSFSSEATTFSLSNDLLTRLLAPTIQLFGIILIVMHVFNQ